MISLFRVRGQLLGPTTPPAHWTTAPGGPALNLSPKSKIKANTLQLVCPSQRYSSRRHEIRYLLSIGKSIISFIFTTAVFVENVIVQQRVMSFAIIISDYFII